MQNDIVILKRVLKSLYQHKRKLAILLLLVLISTGITFVLPIINKYLIDYGIQNNNFAIVLQCALLSLLLVSIDQMVQVTSTRISAYVNNLFSYKWTSSCFKKIMNAKISYLNDKNFTEITNNMRMDITEICKLTDQIFVIRLGGIFKMLGGFVGLLTISYKLAGLILIVIPIRYLLTSYFTKIRKAIFAKYMQSTRSYSAWYGDKLAGVREIKLGGIQNVIMGQFSAHMRGIIKEDIKAQTVDNANMAADNIFFQFITSAIYIIGAFLITRTSLTIGGLFAFATYSINVLVPISSLINIKYDLAKIILSARRLFEFLDMECEEGDKGSVRLSKDNVLGQIDFEGVSFSYDSKNETLYDVSFEINSGEKVGIVGLNGSGKTTVFNILLKLLQPHRGRILLDGTDIAGMNIRDLRKAIAVVNQDAFIFDATIKENISMFRNLSEDKLLEAMQISGANDFVKDLPNQGSTRLGVRGSKLSGGEKQRIAIARAFAKDCRVILLDEATSNFDLKYERQLNDVILNQFDRHTILMITHRPYILNELDKIIVLDKGRVIAVGNHEELAASCDIYANIIAHMASA